jgi:hypothetical protein
MEENRSPTGERLSALETQVRNLDSLYKDLKLIQNEQSKRLEEMSGENISISGKLDTLLVFSQDHIKFHEKQGEKKVNWGNLVANLLIAACAIYALINTQQKSPEVRYIERPAYTQGVENEH